MSGEDIVRQVEEAIRLDFCDERWKGVLSLKSSLIENGIRFTLEQFDRLVSVGKIQLAVGIGIPQSPLPSTAKQPESLETEL
ncbi:MAG: hypothetical protein ACFFEF_16500 [Candidatus Thorarchaeota archaeon]